MEFKLLLLFISGALIANAFPHFVKGILGEKHQTPFGAQSSAVVNVIWAWMNVILAVVFLSLPMSKVQTSIDGTLLIGGGIAMSLFAAWYSTKSRK